VSPVEATRRTLLYRKELCTKCQWPYLTCIYDFEYRGKVYRTSSGKSWKTTKGDVPRFAGLPHVSRRRDFHLASLYFGRHAGAEAILLIAHTESF
jgi:hypothetical protein